MPKNRFQFYKTSKRTEPDMRFELNATFDGLFPEIAKSHPVLLRKMRRDNNNKLIKCECVDILTHEPDKDKFCPFCLGEGFKWDEEWIDTYKVIIRSDVGLSTKDTLHRAGNTNIQLAIFYARSSTDVTEEDKIIEVLIDKEGSPIKPYSRNKVFKIGTSIEFRSDNGKLEYYKLDCHEIQTKFLNGPKG